MNSLQTATTTLCDRVDALRFSAPVTHVYNPLDYARAPYDLYLKKYGSGKKRVIFLGMNPGPFGMVQTGVPFGEVAAARDFLQVEAKVVKPKDETPFRRIEGFASTRSEVSGRRLWGLFASQYGTAEAFAQDHFVLNYCPLAFLENARNVTPDKIAKAEIIALYEACDDYLRTVVNLMQPEWIVGVGKFARKQAEKALKGITTNNGQPLKFGDILHPSPASPAANKGWEPIATAQLQGLGIWPGQPPESKVAPTRRRA